MMILIINFLYIYI